MRKNIGAALCMICFGAIMGYFGAIILYFEWLVSLLLGGVFAIAMQKAHSLGKHVLYDTWYLGAWISTGIFLGGLPIWGMFSSILIEEGKTKWLGLQIFGAAGFFFLGVMLHELFHLITEGESSRIR